MEPVVRPIVAAESDLIIDYFHNATPEFLETMGVDPTRLPPRDPWRERYRRELELPDDKRTSIMLLWLVDGAPAGFSTASDIVYGEHAKMHLHVFEHDRRNSGIGAVCVRKSVDIYFETLRLKRLFCEPHAFNVAPNRTVQKAGFKYLKTHMTVPGQINFHQAVNRWVIER